MGSFTSTGSARVMVGARKFSEKTGHVIFSFVDECQKFLQLFEVDFDERYILNNRVPTVLRTIFDDKFFGR
jgi:hypothetical protein